MVFWLLMALLLIDYWWLIIEIYGKDYMILWMLFIAMNCWRHLGVQIGDPRDQGFADGFWPVDPPISGIWASKTWQFSMSLLKKSKLYVQWY